MSCRVKQLGIVVVMQKTMVSGLARLALRHRWTLVHLPTADRVARTIGRQKVDVAIVHVGVELQQTVELVRWLRATRQEILLVAVASAYREESEAVVRNAGVHCFVPTSDESVLEQVVSSVIEQTNDAQRAAEQRGVRGHRPGRTGFASVTELSSSQAGLRGPASDSRTINPVPATSPVDSEALTIRKRVTGQTPKTPGRAARACGEHRDSLFLLTGLHGPASDRRAR